MRFSSTLAFGVLTLLFGAEASIDRRCAAQDATAPPAADADTATNTNPGGALLPKIGPELLTMTPDDIEKAFEGVEMPEAIKMYLVIARGGQLDGRGGWFGPAQSRFSWQWLAQQCGVDPEDEMAGIKPDQFKADESLFQALDRDKDGQLTRWDLDWSSSNSWVQQSSMIRSIFRRMDASSDFRLSRDEWNAVFEQASQGSDEARFEKIREAWISSSPPGFSPGDEPSKETLVQGLFNSELGSLQEGPDVDEPAPLFELRTLAGNEVVRLEDLIGTKPIVLTFGNFTCGPFRSLYTLVESVRDRRAEDAHFLLVYVREAHPTDGWAMTSNEKLGVAVAQPKTFEDRTLVAQQCAAKLNPKMPLLVDTIDDAVGNAYSGMPARLYVIDKEGKVAYKSGRGPFGFKPEEMEQSLLMLKVQEQLKDNAAVSSASGQPFSLLTDQECWDRMPKAVSGTDQPLPSWARAIAVHLPRTAAAMLQLDHAHRTLSPLDPQLRAKLRWIVADRNQCDYSRRYAIADLRRAGASPEAIERLTGSPQQWSESEREALDFVSRLTTDAPSIPDEQFARLREQFGDQQVAAMVLLAAYGNFQDRIVLGLGLPMEEQGPLPPLDVRFAEGALQVNAVMPDSNPAPELLRDGEDVVVEDGDWSSISFEELQSRLETQRAREPRLPIPTWDEVKLKLPTTMNFRPTRILWNLICYGYATELAVPWTTTTRTMWSEMPGDRVFEESLFWVQTRAVQCNYCMGHCEMLLEVAGLDKAAVAERTRHLSSSDWSVFPPAEQRAYAYARKLSKSPWLLTVDDYRALEQDLGSEEAMSTFWWLCRGLYMTRISDGFQLPLERENVFDNRPTTTK